MRGDIHDSLPSDDNAMEVDNSVVHYMVHPSVDIDIGSAAE